MTLGLSLPCSPIPFAYVVGQVGDDDGRCHGGGGGGGGDHGCCIDKGRRGPQKPPNPAPKMDKVRTNYIPQVLRFFVPLQDPLSFLQPPNSSNLVIDIVHA